MRPRDKIAMPSTPPSHALMHRGLLSPNGSVDPGRADGDLRGHLAARQPLPLVELFSGSRDRTSFTATSSIDDRGTLTDRAAVKELGWAPGTTVSISTLPEAGIVIIRRSGSDAVSGRGHLRLPARVRHRLRLSAGDRLLLLALVHDDILLAYLASAIDRMVTALHAGITEQETR
ncbi:hypothetical protein [Micromonospora sp. NPDC049107]|uniref:hypothetical protein n=1 Tax=unclassified Micromonospora TaxID=2617518 RepID=UPI0033F4FA6F